MFIVKPPFYRPPKNARISPNAQITKTASIRISIQNDAPDRHLISVFSVSLKTSKERNVKNKDTKQPMIRRIM
jgi:hypothetical protein